MLKRGVNLAPSAFEAGFISSAHSDEDIEFTIQAAKETFAEMSSKKPVLNGLFNLSYFYICREQCFIPYLEKSN